MSGMVFDMCPLPKHTAVPHLSPPSPTGRNTTPHPLSVSPSLPSPHCLGGERQTTCMPLYPTPLPRWVPSPTTLHTPSKWWVRFEIWFDPRWWRLPWWGCLPGRGKGLSVVCGKAWVVVVSGAVVTVEIVPPHTPSLPLNV